MDAGRVGEALDFSSGLVAFMILLSPATLTRQPPICQRLFVHQTSSSPGMPLVRPATPEDAERICAIYNHYVLHAVATFEESPVSQEQMRIPAKMNARSGDGERRFRASRTLIGAKRRQQWVS
jgi:hypothetical protein